MVENTNIGKAKEAATGNSTDTVYCLGDQEGFALFSNGLENTDLAEGS